MIHYMDDILIGSNNFEEMYAKLERVLTVLRECGLTLNLDKCKLYEQSITFLGHQIHDGGISPGEVKTNAISMFPTPTNVTELLYGYEPRDILKNTLTSVIQNQEQRMMTDVELDTLRADAATRVNDKRAAAKKRYDAKHAKPTQYKLGDIVLVENEPISTGTSRKLEPRYKGPFIVNKVLPNDRYLVEDIPQAQRKQRHYKSVYASDKMKRRCELPEDDQDDGDD
ncbi:uncharacterized protein Dana_GF26348 [Drosophila ananassae]|uniref:Reverse transcriptase domain-containing protein n=1 Tax=Drosophila ananassae TaxID=7217 RepID=A0A0P8XJ62_DROAN|nr:uncharacterized protein Dana_GF26348 [Drosophila ananassae]